MARHVNQLVRYYSLSAIWISQYGS